MSDPSVFQFLGFGPGFWLVAALAVFITGVSKSGFAGGVGVVAVPLMSLFVDPRQAAAIMLPLLICMDFFSVRIWYGKQDKRQLKLLFPATVIGVLIGYLLFDWLDANVIRVMVGLLAILFALWGLSQIKVAGETRAGHKGWGRFCGVLTGFTSFVAHAGGPPLSLYMLPLRLPRETYLATVVILMTGVNLVKLVPYAALGQLKTDNLAAALVLMPLAFVGVKLGVKLQARINDKLFYRLIYTALILIGIKLLYDAF
ncbi:sulfite exporter TauE/SafE family protein [Parathalassolituus penaei]|uniref:Probable membrane transporter protein n=1 Tax=Parathalassolituus penaei TaxID=2997323 RepID=A0A9X3IV93_9GAMM|nr:sulfite exporter TauE/SafE family protein [Parathalassolituus penaei]MCY0967013.1 sulfite exporter TauE/SafE family protein [Parathalassolituus penaei]